MYSNSMTAKAEPEETQPLLHNPERTYRAWRYCDDGKAINMSARNELSQKDSLAGRQGQESKIDKTWQSGMKAWQSSAIDMRELQGQDSLI